MEEKDFEGFKKLFFGVFRNLSPVTRQQTCIKMEEKPYSWNVVYEEIINETELSKKMLKKLIELKLI